MAKQQTKNVRECVIGLGKVAWGELDGVRTSESPFGAPAILFSVDSMGLSEATVGPSSYSPPRGIVLGAL